MKIKLLASLTLFPVMFQTALAAWPPVNALCEKARVAELSIFDGEERTEVCETSAIPKTEYLAALNDLSEINNKASKLLNISLAQLFPKGVAVEISAGLAGLNGSAKAGKNRITLEIYTNPSRWVNKGIYAHELGHALTSSTSPQIPAALKGTFRSTLLGETIADTMAFALVGEETSHETNLPLCFSPKRVTYNQSYVAHAGFFDGNYQLHKLSVCCQEYANFSPATKTICENVLTDEGGETIVLPPYDSTLFDYRNKSAHEEHRIGIPINSFLLTLGQHVGKDLFKEFIKSYADLDSVKFQCQFKGSEIENEKILAEGWALKPQLQKIRSNLPIAQRINFDSLWTELGLQAAVIMDDAEILSRTSSQAEKIFIKAIRKNKTMFKGKRHCAEVFENAETDGYPDNSCDIKCSKF